MATRAVEARITGTVQGVFFRAECREQARRLDVNGWVRNEPDGAVAARFEGEEEAVAQLLDWCRSGPSQADVQDVEVRDVTPTGDAGFRVV